MINGEIASGTKRHLSIMQLSENYWRHVVYALKLACSIVEMLRMVDDERKLTLSYIYEAMHWCKRGQFQGIQWKKRRV